jgi:hypothetical protein
MYYVLGHGFKLLGGALGGLVAARRLRGAAGPGDRVATA